VPQAARDLLGVGVQGARECHVSWPHTQGIRRRGEELRIRRFGGRGARGAICLYAG
jgi:hypothetical protein